MEVGVTTSKEFKDHKLSLDSVGVGVVFEAMENFLVRYLGR
jgi:hypothetical protein